jgi:hypothetical protein
VAQAFAASNAEATPHVATTVRREALDKLVQTLRPSIDHHAELSGLDKAQKLYGAALGRIITAMGGFPLHTRERCATLARLLASDAALREELARIAASDDAVALERLHALFVGEKSNAPVSASAAKRDAGEPSHATAAAQREAHIAALADEHAHFLVANTVPPMVPREPEPESDEPLERTHRVEPVQARGRRPR